MAASYNKFNQFVADLANGVHNLGSDVLQVALTNSAPSVANTVLANIAEVSYAYCSARSLSVISSAQSGGIYRLLIANLTLLASGGSVGPFRYFVIYNSTPPTRPLIAWFDYGISVVINESESLPLTFDATGGLIQLQIGS